MAETIKIAVCDDEKNIRSYLVLLIKKQGGEYGITEYASADEYLSDGKEHDIIFLDIEMGGSGAGIYRHLTGNQHCCEKPRRQADADREGSGSL